MSLSFPGARRVCGTVIATAALMSSFAASAAYTFSVIAYTGLPTTQAWQINNLLQIPGTAQDPAVVGSDVSFVYQFGTNTFTLLPPVAPGILASPIGINDGGALTGAAVDITGAAVGGVGFVYSGGVYTMFAAPGAEFTSGRAITNGGRVTGYSNTAAGVASAFTYAPSTGVLAPIATLGSQFVIAQGTNAAGAIVGGDLLAPNVAYAGAPGGYYGFVRRPGGALTYFRVNGNRTRARGINDLGQIVGWMNDASVGAGGISSFMVTVPTGASYVDVTVAASDRVIVPGALRTYAEGINNTGYISGESSDAIDVTTGFVASPPAPSQIGALIAVVTGFGLPHGTETSLQAKLSAAQAALGAGNVVAACGDLNALINQANAQSGKKLTVAQANLIITMASAIRVTLGCS